MFIALKTSSIKFLLLLSEPGSDFPFHHYHDEGHDMLARIFTGSPLPARDKVYINAVETSCIACRKKFKVTPSTWKVLTVFWDHESILLPAFQSQG
jgi:hypothetical protein